MKSRRAGHGGSSGDPVAPARGRAHDVEAPPGPAREPSDARTTLGDDPRIAAALRYAGEDVRAYEQTEAAWRAVWADEAEVG
jgi:hypothetical protein